MQSFNLYHARLDPTDRHLLDLLRLPSAPQPSGCPPAAWESMVTKAIDLAVGPLLYAATRQRCDSQAPPEAAARLLRGHYTESALRNFALYRQLHGLLQHLAGHEIPVIVLKGAYLAQAIYQDAALRLMSDIDLLIRHADRARVQHLLSELGYVQQPVESAAADSLHHDLYVHPGYPVEVEIHWALVSQDAPFPIDLDRVWQAAGPGTVAGVSVQTLSSADMVLHLCIHMTYQHVCDRYCLRCLCDLQRFIHARRDQIDWKIVQQQARAWHCEHNVHFALLMSQLMLDAPVPPAVVEQLRPTGFDDRLVIWATHRILGLVDDRQGPWSANLGHWRLASTWTEKVALVQQICFPPRPELASQTGIPLDSPCLLLIYPRHWGELAWRGLRMALRLDKAKTEHATVSWTEREIGRSALVRWMGREKEGDPV